MLVQHDLSVLLVEKEEKQKELFDFIFNIGH